MVCSKFYYPIAAAQSSIYLANIFINLKYTMSDGLSAHRAYCNQYAGSQPYEYKQTYSNSLQRRTGSNIAEKEKTQSPYSINNLPIIYDDATRGGTPLKSSSRVVYTQKQLYLSSPVSKFETMPFNQPKPLPDLARASYQTHETTSQVETIISKYSTNKYGPPGVIYPSDEAKSASRTIIDGLSAGQYHSDTVFPQPKVISYKMVQPISHESIVNKIEVSSVSGLKNQNKDFRSQVKPDYQVERRVEYKIEQKQKNGSRLLMEKINQDLPPGFPPRSVNSYVANEIEYGPVSEIPIRNNQNALVNNSYGVVSASQPIAITNQTYTFQNIPENAQTIHMESNFSYNQGKPPQPIPPPPASTMPQPQQKTYMSVAPTSTMPINNLNNLTFMGDHYSHQHSTTVGRHLSMETVPRIQYDRCVTECKNWETKYNELYLKYMNLATTTSMAANNPQLEVLRQENYHLRREAKQQSQMSTAFKNNVKNASMLESRFNELVEAQREATIKECMLLLQRYKLE